MVVSYKFTEYFEKEVLRKHPYLKKDWCIQVVKPPTRVNPKKGIVLFLEANQELDGRMLRVVTLADKVTIHNAFPDRGFKP
jgi:hypothetical protein